MTLVTAMPRAGLPMLSAIPVPGNPFRLSDDHPGPQRTSGQFRSLDA